MANPRLVLADEPTAALDKDSGRDVVDLLQRMAKQHNCAILLVTHDARILDIADRIVNMVDGSIASDIDVDESVAACQTLAQCDAFPTSDPLTLRNISQKMSREQYQAATSSCARESPGRSSI